MASTLLPLLRSSLARTPASSLLAPLTSAKSLSTSSAGFSPLAPAISQARIPVTMIPGDGVGPELVQAVEDVFKVK